MRSLFLGILFLPFLSWAQTLPTIEQKTSGLKKEEGLFTFYRDEEAGKVWLEIGQFDSLFLYLVSLPAGLGSNDIGLDRGLQDGGRLVKFSRSGRKVLLIQPNTDYRAIQGDRAEKGAVEQSFAQSVLWGFTIEAQTRNSVLVDLSEFLLRDAMQVAVRIRKMQQGNYSVERSRSTLYTARVKNFPRNSEFEATVTFVSSDGSAGSYLQSVVPSAEAFTVRMHHSFIQLPEPGFQPRLFDPRSSFIPLTYFDYTTPVAEPIQQYYAIRHRLQKKDPFAPVSDPVHPIIYYLDRGTPEPIRSALVEGASWWNQAFEAAGYRNAFQVALLPDSADPMDIRYNVINWVHRSTRGWSYGASVVDPRTGEIIKGQVTLGSLRVRQDYLIAQGLLAALRDTLPQPDPMLTLALSRLRQLAAHEVGHTLGLMHNYASSARNRSSVMDYPHPWVRLTGKQSITTDSAYDDKIGAWDKMAIRWGYQDFPPGVDPSAALRQILTEAIREGLLFISDRDARAPGGLHPQAHLWDNGSDPVAELKNVMQVRAKALQQFGTNNIRSGTPMAFLEDVLVPIYFYHRYQLEAVIKQIGGMSYTYALKGDGQEITHPVFRARQREALNAVLDCIDPAALQLPDQIVHLIPPRPAGYDFNRELFKKRTGLAFDALAPAETAVDLAFSFLFHPERLSRMAQEEVKGGLGVTEFLDRLIQATWKAPRQKGPHQLLQLQTEQVLLTYLLSSSIDDNLSFAARSSVVKALRDLKVFIELQQKQQPSTIYEAHLVLALERFKTPEKAKPTLHMAIPPGAPIGCDWED